MMLLALLRDLVGDVKHGLIGLRVGETAIAKLFVRVLLLWWPFERLFRKAIFALTSAAVVMSEPRRECDSTFSLRYAGNEGD